MINTQITVFLGCLINDSEVLMIQRDEKECSEAHLKWELPGGKVNFNEACQETVNREFLEETGIKIKAGNLLPHAQVNYWNYPGGIRQQTLVFCFKCQLIKEGLIQKGLVQRDHHVKDIKWIKLKEIDKMETLPGIKEFIKLAVARPQSV